MFDPESGIEISEELIRRFDSLGPRYTSYPTADRFHTDFDEAAYIGYLQTRSRATDKPPLSLYIHLPFCASLCYYCACNKIITKDHGRSAKYLHYLDKELALVHRHLAQRETLSQLHLGGGTPTFLSQNELRQLMQMLHQYFDFSDDAERSIEIDPRTVDGETIALLRELGFNRTSLGVQDFDPGVQQAIHRIQPLEMVERTVVQCRDAGFGSLNFDLIYGLPRQNIDSFGRTIDEVIRLSPDRIALYNYAHLPSRFKAQRRIADHDMPSAELRLQVFIMSLRRLQDAGYVYIGLDHFAKPDDSLTQAWRERSLHRNFQGYTTRAECDLLGLGMSSIGKIGKSYVQSHRTLDDYYGSLDAGHLPVEKGFFVSDDDLLRRSVIMDLMCSQPIAFDRFPGIDFAEYFGSELAGLKPLADEGLIELDDKQLSITRKGRMFVRAVGMRFDRYLAQASGATYSKLI